MMGAKLADFLPEDRSKIKFPSLLHKGGCTLHVVGFIPSFKAKNYVNVSFYGLLVGRMGSSYNVMDREFVLGQYEIDKETGFVDENNIRISRFDNRKGLIEFQEKLKTFLEKR